MTVKELIEELNKYPLEADVVCFNGDEELGAHCNTALTIETVTNGDVMIYGGSYDWRTGEVSNEPN